MWALRPDWPPIFQLPILQYSCCHIISKATKIWWCKNCDLWWTSLLLVLQMQPMWYQEKETLDHNASPKTTRNHPRSPILIPPIQKAILLSLVMNLCGHPHNSEKSDEALAHARPCSPPTVEIQIIHPGHGIQRFQTLHFICYQASNYDFRGGFQIFRGSVNAIKCMCAKSQDDCMAKGWVPLCNHLSNQYCIELWLNIQTMA